MDYESDAHQANATSNHETRGLKEGRRLEGAEIYQARAERRIALGHRFFICSPERLKGRHILQKPFSDNGKTSMCDSEQLKDEVNDQVLMLLRHVIGESHTRTETDEIARALLYFLLREANTWRSIRTLHEHVPDEEGPMVDAGSLLRVMFDAYLQAEYVVGNEREASERAKDYLEFEHVEKYKRVQAVTEFDNSFTRKLKASPHRPSGEKRLQEEYDRVKSRYFTEKRLKNGKVKRGPGLRPHWYRGSLANVAKSLGKSDEYRILLSTFHGCVHSNPFAIRFGPPISRDVVLHWASRIALRVARLSVAHNDIQLSKLHAKMLDSSCKPYFN